MWVKRKSDSYSCILRGFGLTPFESDSVALVLEALRCDETLDTRSFSIWFFPFSFRLYFAADDEFADLRMLEPYYVDWVFML